MKCIVTGNQSTNFAKHLSKETQGVTCDTCSGHNDVIHSVDEERHDIFFFISFPERDNHTLEMVMTARNEQERKERKRKIFLAALVYKSSNVGRFYDAGCDFVGTVDRKHSQARSFIASVRAIKYRESSPIIECRELKLNTSNGRATFNNKTLKLTKKEFDFLAILIRNRSRVVSRMQIYEELYDDDTENISNIIDVFAFKVREKLNKIKPSSGYEVIETVRGWGYMISDEDTSAI